MSMFCYQCEQTAKGEGCTKVGVCGKDPETAALQNLLIHAAKTVSAYAHRARELGAADRDVDLFVVEALFTTVTNVNFDTQRLAGLLRDACSIRQRAAQLYEVGSAIRQLFDKGPRHSLKLVRDATNETFSDPAAVPFLACGAPGESFTCVFGWRDCTDPTLQNMRELCDKAFWDLGR